MFEVGDIVLDIDGRQSGEPLYGIITAVRKDAINIAYGDEKSYFIDWFDNGKGVRYADYMYESELEKALTAYENPQNQNKSFKQC